MSDNGLPDMEERKQRTAGVFGRAAATYDQVGPHFFAHFGRRLVALAGIPAGSSVLDVAMGRGALLLPAIESAGPHGHVVGIDIAETMVLETSKALARLKLPPNYELRRMDAEHLEFPDESFDYVLCGFAIFFFPQLTRAMSEFRRVLKPGGRLCVSTWDKSGDDKWKWFDDLVDAHLPPQSQHKHAHDSDLVNQPVFDTAEGLRAILESAGFGNIQITPEAAEFTYATSEEFWLTLWSHGKRGTLEDIEKAEGTEGLQRFKMEVVSKLESLGQHGGIHDLLKALIGLATKPQD
jgi:O-methyltransferase / aklanonic acid methyltransferase